MAKRISALINLGAIRRNAVRIKEKSGGKKLVGVVKANAYGHGDVMVARELSDICDMFAVAEAHEALHLRKNGIGNDIMILSMIPEEDIKECVENGIILTVSSLSEGERISHEAKSIGRIARVHAAVDTGMSRIGFRIDEGAERIKKLSELENLKVEGIFSHYAVSDIKDKTFTALQTERFKKVCAVSGEGRLCHIANSAAIMDLDSVYGEAVRAGIILYGLLPSDEVDKNSILLEPALTFKSRVSFVKDIEKGDAVSYGLTFTADKKMRIATVSAGYADGYPRSLSGKGRVLINGKSHKIVGRICMDQFMVDVTGSDVKADDEVILIGKSGNEYISADEVANLAGTINYEIVCLIGARVPRIYVKGEK